MKTKVKKKHSVILTVALIVLAVWMVISLIQLHTDISDKQTVLADINTQIANQQRANDELASENANDDLYLDQQAHDKGLAKPGESIYKEVPGN